MSQKQGNTMPVVRLPDFKIGKGDLEGHYLDDNAFLTHLLNGLHVVFPEGEQLFIRSVKFFIKDVDDAKLKKRVKAFIGQEKQHQIQHEALWDALDGLGYDAREFAKWFENHAYGNNGIEGNIAKVLPERMYHELALAVTAALEHYTATLAETVLEDTRLIDSTPPKVRELLGWHASEEIEHKSVTYDLLQEVNDSYLLRQVGFLLGSFCLIFYGGAGAYHFARRDKNVSALSFLKSIWDGSQLIESVFVKMVPELMQYFKPDFHPDNIDTDHLAYEFLSKTEIKTA